MCLGGDKCEEVEGALSVVTLNRAASNSLANSFPMSALRGGEEAEGSALSTEVEDTVALSVRCCLIGGIC